jgi:hypothetical protein
LIEQAVATGEAALGPDHPGVAVFRGSLGGVLNELGDWLGAAAQNEQVLAILRATLGPTHPDVVNAEI